MPLASAWDPERRLTYSSGAQTSINFARNIAADSQGQVNVVWFEEHNGGGQELFTQWSLDGGTTWQPPLRLTDAPGDSHFPSIAATADAFHIARWETRDDRPVIYHARSLDAGLTWSADMRLTDHPADSVRPFISVDGSSLYVVWWDTRNSDEEIYARHSPDRGQTWEPDSRLTNNPGRSVFASVAAAVSGVHIVWQDTRDGQPEVYYKRRLP